MSGTSLGGGSQYPCPLGEDLRGMNVAEQSGGLWEPALSLWQVRKRISKEVMCKLRSEGGREEERGDAHSLSVYWVLRHLHHFI